jgi:hypothetical protein
MVDQTGEAALVSIDLVANPVLLIEGNDVAAFANLDALLSFVEPIDISVFKVYDASGRVIRLASEGGRVVAEVTDEVRTAELELALRAFLRQTTQGEVRESLEDLVSRINLQPDVE